MGVCCVTQQLVQWGLKTSSWKKLGPYILARRGGLRDDALGPTRHRNVVTSVCSNGANRRAKRGLKCWAWTRHRSRRRGVADLAMILLCLLRNQAKSRVTKMAQRNSIRLNLTPRARGAKVCSPPSLARSARAASPARRRNLPRPGSTPSRCCRSSLRRSRGRAPRATPRTGAPPTGRAR